MKNLSDTYSGREEAIKRKPVELYRLYDLTGNVDERYTSSDIAISYGGYSYVPASIARTALEYNTEFETSELTLTVDYLNPAISEFIAFNPPETIWVEVLKTFRDYTTEADVIFTGQIASVAIKGISAKVKVVGFESFLNRPAASKRYQRQCNHILGDTECGLNLVTGGFYNNYMINTMSADGLTLTMSGSGASDGIFTLGYLENTAGNWVEKRMIVNHVGNTINLRYKLGESPVGQPANIYYGCDGAIQTCYDRFNNVDNFLGFPYIPSDNPATRSLA